MTFEIETNTGTVIRDITGTIDIETENLENPISGTISIGGYAAWRHLPKNIICLSQSMIESLGDKLNALNSVGLNYIGCKQNTKIMLSHELRRCGHEAVIKTLTKFFTAIGATNINLVDETDVLVEEVEEENES